MQIRPELQHLIVDINTLQPHPRNVRQGDIGAICESLKTHGQYRPIVVQQSTNHIIAGNHTYKACKALKWKQIACTYIDCDDEQALRIMLVDNKANDQATYDDAQLAQLLTELSNTNDALQGTGFDLDDIEQLIKLFEDTTPPDTQHTPKKIECPVCGAEFTNKN